MMFKKFSFYIFTLLFSTVILCNQIPNREIIVLLETLDAENINISLDSSNQYQMQEGLEPAGLGAITITMLIALYEQASPIIANKSLIKNIIDHQNIFSDFVNLDLNSLYGKYSRHNKFKQPMALDNFRTTCKYISKSVSEVNKILGQSIKSNDEDHIYGILDKIVTDKRFNLKFAPSSIKNLGKNQINALILEMVTYILCSWIDFQNDWTIKQVNNDIFLLMPNDYITNLNLNNAKNLSRNNCGWTNLELELGLKIDHMKNVDRSFFEKRILNNVKTDSFTKSLGQIFITNSDIKKSNLPKTIKYIWSVYMSGHGLPKNQHMDLLPQVYALKELLNKKLKAPQFKTCIAYEKNKHHRLPKDEKHLNSCQNHNICKAYIDQIKELNKDIHNIEVMAQPANKSDFGIIASLPIDEFSEVLRFLNSEIETALFYYSSCFGGGPHLIEPYIVNGKPLVLKYPIISNTTAENKGSVEVPNINLPPYSKTGISIAFEPSEIHIQDIDLTNQKLKLNTILHFNRFFNALRNGAHNNQKNLLLVPYSLSPHVNTFGEILNNQTANIPLIRLANSDHFQPIPNDQSCVLLDSQNSSKAITINKDATLIYTNYVPGKMTLNISKDHIPPRLISMIPGFALHVFEDINSSTLNLKDTINSFLTFSDLSSPKIFWIKKLECKSNTQGSKTIILNDVIIMRNIFNPDPSAHRLLEDCAYISTDLNKDAKLTWDGPILEDRNYKITACNIDGHKEECINCFPNMTNFVNPILQSI